MAVHSPHRAWRGRKLGWKRREGGMEDVKQEMPDEELKKSLANLQRGVGEAAIFLSGHQEFGGMFLSDLLRVVMPPVMLNQYRIIRDRSGRTAGFVSWALASEEVVARLMRGQFKLRSDDWRSGDTLVVMDVAAPSAEAGRRFLMELRRQEFADKEVWVLHPSAAQHEPKLRVLGNEG